MKKQHWRKNDYAGILDDNKRRLKLLLICLKEKKEAHVKSGKVLQLNIINGCKIFRTTVRQPLVEQAPYRKGVAGLS